MSKPIPPSYKPPVTAEPAAAAPTSRPKPPPYKPPSTPATPANAPVVTAEGVMQRLRYFENLAVQHEAYIETLKALIQRQGAAIPVAYFAPLTGAGGSHTPKSG